MEIKELNLIGFGKFNNETINLRNSINIIYGENEAGKTTIHNFIDGMFYGFLRHGARRTLYVDEHDKYVPWSGSKYTGIIKFKHNGEEYIIEREFTRANEKTTVLIYSTGEDITNDIETGNAGRVLQPGHHFFGFSDAVYSNTVSIKQLGSKTEDSLANEIRDKLINMSTTADDSLSIEKAVEELDKSIKDIGSTRAPTSVYGRTTKSLENLKKEKERILELEEKYKETLESDTELKGQLSNKNRELKELEKKLDNAKLLEKINIYNKAKGIKENISDLQLNSEKYKEYKDLSQDDYYESIRLDGDIKHLDKSIKENNDLLSETNIALEKLSENKVNQPSQDNNIDIDYNKYEDLEDKRDKLQYREDSFGEKELLKRDYDNALKARDNFKIFSKTAISITVIINILGIISLNFLLLLLNIVLIPSILFVVRKEKDIAELIEDILSKINKIQQEEVNRGKQLKQLEQEQNSILEKYNINSKRELKNLYSNWQFESYNIDARKKSLTENKDKKDKLTKIIKELENDKRDKLLNLNINLNKNKSKTLSEFKSLLDKKDKYNEMTSKIEKCNALLGKELDKYKLEDLEEDLKEYKKRNIEIHETKSIDELEEDISKKSNEISTLEADIKVMEERLNNLNEELKRSVEIDEEIERKERAIEEMDKKKEFIELAKDTIETLSKDIHRQFAPTINKKVGEIIDTITNGKYNRVRIDDELEIKILNPITEEMININSLSGGTIDQLYFSLRFGIINSIRNESLPLILDDCFIQYDDYRLRNMMKYLADVGKERQVLLFTCQNREKDILESMDLDFNLVNLA